jgi:hypothetical protein
MHVKFIFFSFCEQQASGADLAILLVDVMIKAETPTTEEHIRKLSK